MKTDGFRFSPLVLPHQELLRDLLPVHICLRVPYQEVPSALWPVWSYCHIYSKLQ